MTPATRPARQGEVQTVLGPIAPDDLGPTLMHEHLLCDIRHPSQRTQEALGPELALDNVWAINYGTVKRAARNYLLDARDVAVDEVKRMLAAGGRSAVDLSSGGLSPDPSASSRSPAPPAPTSSWAAATRGRLPDPANARRAVEDFAEEMVESVQDGAWGTDVRAGIIGEIGCQAPGPPRNGGSCWAPSSPSGKPAPPSMHPGRHPDQPQEVADFVRVKGGRMDRLIISHIDRTVFDVERLRRLADTGCVLEWDLFGQESSYYPLADIDMPNDAVRLRAIRDLIERGHLAQVLISHDICYRSRLVRWGGHGYGHIFANVVPLMRRRGFSEAEVQAILVDNPRRLLTLGSGPA